MLLFIILLFIVAPIAEIFVLLAAGDAFGIWPVVGACIFTAVLGGVLLKSQGAAALLKAKRVMGEGKVPVESVIDGVLLAISAPFLMTPGFLTDIVGFSLLIPPVRQWIGHYALQRLKQKIDRGEAQIHIHRP